jgi:prepilin-type N-terminal cleavage/methylation domain-containing protein
MMIGTKKDAFSLTEVLMAVGILSMGMMLIATMFPVGIYLTGVGTERTMASIVIDEALAKIQLYDVNLASPKWAVPPDTNSTPYEDVSGTAIDPNEFSYPSVDPCSTNNGQYYWSALCRRIDPAGTECQVTIFAARKTGPNHTYPDPNDFANPPIDRPRLIKIDISLGPANNELTIVNAGEEGYINPPTVVVDNATGTIYRVINRSGTTITIERGWENLPNATDSIWLIPPPVSGGKNAGVEVYQEPITF